MVANASSIWSVRSRRSEASTTSRICSGLLSRPTVSLFESILKPNFVLTDTLPRTGASYVSVVVSMTKRYRTSETSTLSYASLMASAEITSTSGAMLFSAQKSSIS